MNSVQESSEDERNEEVGGGSRRVVWSDRRSQQRHSSASSSSSSSSAILQTFQSPPVPVGPLTPILEEEPGSVSDPKRYTKDNLGDLFPFSYSLIPPINYSPCYPCPCEPETSRSIDITASASALFYTVPVSKVTSRRKKATEILGNPSILKSFRRLEEPTRFTTGGKRERTSSLASRPPISRRVSAANSEGTSAAVSFSSTSLRASVHSRANSERSESRQSSASDFSASQQQQLSIESPRMPLRVRMRRDEYYYTETSTKATQTDEMELKSGAIVSRDSSSSSRTTSGRRLVKVQTVDRSTSPIQPANSSGSQAGHYLQKLEDLEKITGHFVIQRFFTRSESEFTAWLEQQLANKAERKDSSSSTSMQIQTDNVPQEATSSQGGVTTGGVRITPRITDVQRPAEIDFIDPVLANMEAQVMQAGKATVLGVEDSSFPHAKAIKREDSAVIVADTDAKETETSKFNGKSVSVETETLVSKHKPAADPVSKTALPPLPNESAKIKDAANKSEGNVGSKLGQVNEKQVLRSGPKVEESASKPETPIPIVEKTAEIKGDLANVPLDITAKSNATTKSDHDPSKPEQGNGSKSATPIPPNETKSQPLAAIHEAKSDLTVEPNVPTPPPTPRPNSQPASPKEPKLDKKIDSKKESSPELRDQTLSATKGTSETKLKDMLDKQAKPESSPTLASLNESPQKPEERTVATKLPTSPKQSTPEPEIKPSLSKQPTPEPEIKSSLSKQPTPEPESNPSLSKAPTPEPVQLAPEGIKSKLTSPKELTPEPEPPKDPKVKSIVTMQEVTVTLERPPTGKSKTPSPVTSARKCLISDLIPCECFAQHFLQEESIAKLLIALSPRTSTPITHTSTQPPVKIHPVESFEKFEAVLKPSINHPPIKHSESFSFAPIETTVMNADGCQEFPPFVFPNPGVHRVKKSISIDSCLGSESVKTTDSRLLEEKMADHLNVSQDSHSQEDLKASMEEEMISKDSALGNASSKETWYDIKTEKMSIPITVDAKAKEIFSAESDTESDIIISENYHARSEAESDTEATTDGDAMADNLGNQDGRRREVQDTDDDDVDGKDEFMARMELDELRLEIEKPMHIRNTCTQTNRSLFSSAWSDATTSSSATTNGSECIDLEVVSKKFCSVPSAEGNRRHYLPSSSSSLNIVNCNMNFSMRGDESNFKMSVSLPGIRSRPGAKAPKKIAKVATNNQDDRDLPSLWAHVRNRLDSKVSVDIPQADLPVTEGPPPGPSRPSREGTYTRLKERSKCERPQHHPQHKHFLRSQHHTDDRIKRSLERLSKLLDIEK